MPGTLQRPDPPPLFRTSLEPIETNAPPAYSAHDFTAAPPLAPSPSPIRRPTPPTSCEINFRHGFWATRRSRVRQALLDSGQTERRIEAFDCCGSGALVLVDDETGALRLAACHCKDRFCEACQQTRRVTVQRNLIPLVEQQRTLHVVLTPLSTDEPLATCIKRLYQHAATLRRRPFWRNRVAGGSQTLEVTYNADTGQWHPHLHLLVHAEWLGMADLSSEWHQVTGNAHRVHVSLVRSEASATREVTKYLGKILHRSYELIPERIAEAVEALKGVRLIGTFGTWRKHKLTSIPKPAEPIIWRIVCTLQKLLDLAKAKNAWAMEALRHLDSRHVHPTPSQGSAHDAAP